LISIFASPPAAFIRNRNVDAEVLRFRPCKNPLFNRDEEASVLEPWRAAFSAPRKMIRNSLASGLGISSQDAESALAEAQIDSTARAESLSPEDFVRLARAQRQHARTSRS